MAAADRFSRSHLPAGEHRDRQPARWRSRFSFLKLVLMPSGWAGARRLCHVGRDIAWAASSAVPEPKSCSRSHRSVVPGSGRRARRPGAGFVDRPRPHFRRRARRRGGLRCPRVNRLADPPRRLSRTTLASWIGYVVGSSLPAAFSLFVPIVYVGGSFYLSVWQGTSTLGSSIEWLLPTPPAPTWSAHSWFLPNIFPEHIA